MPVAGEELAHTIGLKVRVRAEHERVGHDGELHEQEHREKSDQLAALFPMEPIGSVEKIAGEADQSQENECEKRYVARVVREADRLLREQVDKSEHRDEDTSESYPWVDPGRCEGER